MKNVENMKRQVELAESKKQVLLQNISNLEAKKVRIEEQIAAQRAKIEKIDFFLKKQES